MPGRALFLNPPIILGRDFIDYPWFAGHGVISTAAIVARAGWSVDVADAFAQHGSGRFEAPDGGYLLGVTLREFVDSLPEGPYDLVVVGLSPFLRIWGRETETVLMVRELAGRYPESTLVLSDCHQGGMHYVDYDAQAALEEHPGADVLVKYSGERAFSNPDGLAGLKGRGEVVMEPAFGPGEFEPPFPMIESIDQADFSAFLWRVFEEGRWANTFDVGPKTRPFMTSFGCPFRCVFCSSNPDRKIGDGSKRYRAIEPGIVEQRAYLTARLTGADKLFIMDEMANLRPDFEEVLAALNGLGLRYEFPNGLRADRLSGEAISMMKDHVSLLYVSAESGSQQDLDGPIGKRLSLDDVERVSREASSAGVPLSVHFIVGFPWETPAHIQATLGLAWRLYERFGAMPAVQFAAPLPGTDLYDICLEDGLVRPDEIEGLMRDGALFQHRPAFDVKGMPGGYLETAVESLDRKISASNARKVIINITYECINKCVFCAVSNRVRRDIPWPRLSEMIREHRERGIDQLDLDGGEPTLHENLLDAIALAREEGYRQVNVTTNGRRLQDRDFAERLVRSGITSLLISLHGESAKVHDAATGVSGSFEETLDGLRNALSLKPEGVDFGVNTTISKYNVGHLDALAEMLEAERVTKVNFQFLTPFGSAGGHVVPPTGDAAEAVMRVIDRYVDRIEIQVINAQFCFFPGYERFLAGDMQKLGRTMVFVTDEEVNLFDYLAERRMKKPECVECPWSLVCEGFHVFSEGESDVQA